MSKKEVYEGYRFPCEDRDLFRWERMDGTANWRLFFNEVWYKRANDFKDKTLVTKLELRNFLCPCGKGCKPQKVRIIVEEV